jgi:hypothetical protein
VAERDLAALLVNLNPRRHTGIYVFCSVPSDGVDVAAADAAVVTVQEDEGTTLVVTSDEAERHGWPSTFPCTWITLRVTSALDAVGLTAVVATALAADGIPANVVAGFHHDHVFVPVDRGAAAMRVLAALSKDENRIVAAGDA